ncbi:MAG: Hvo_1808 family surface protein, partial [Halobacteriota archaeon]
MRKAAGLSLALLIVLSGVAPFAGLAGAAGSDAAATPQLSDPPEDTIGWENGYWHNETITVDQSDGLSDAELDAYVSRAKARVEFLRDREFRDPVPVEVIPRDQYRDDTSSQEVDATFNAWNNQVWEALFIVGEESDTSNEISSTLGSSVAGFYSPEDDEIKIITDSPNRPVIDNGTLIHELTHAMQDQYYNLSSSTYRPTTQDTQLATDGVVEGEANYIEDLYTERCAADWECVATPRQSGGSAGGSPPNLGLFLTIFQPYSDGPVYVENAHREAGWSAVDALFETPPHSTEQVIHVTDEEPRLISFEDDASNGWQTFPEQGENGSDTVGEASIYAMFWYQARTYDADTINPQNIARTSGPYDTYNYDAAPSEGWANDRVFPYQRGSGDDAEYGYVWVTEWDSRADAREFHDAYLAILHAHDATQTDGVYVVESGPFADAFRVVRDGTRVTIVNGPTPSDLRDIRPNLDPAASSGTPSDARTDGDETG